MSLFVSYEREKLLHAIIYFVQNTKHCHKLKLFKLLSFLDFEHYRQTGRPVTGLAYEAWKLGPVPSDLDAELNRPQPDLDAAVAVFKAPAPGARQRTIEDFADAEELPHFVSPGSQPSDGERFEFRAKKRFNSKIFTKRELQILKTLSEVFRYARGYDMTEVSHLRNLPWRKVWRNGKGNRRPIPYELALSSDPMIADTPTIEPEELAYREEALRGVQKRSGT